MIKENNFNFGIYVLEPEDLRRTAMVNIINNELAYNWLTSLHDSKELATITPEELEEFRQLVELDSTYGAIELLYIIAVVFQDLEEQPQIER